MSVKSMVLHGIPENNKHDNNSEETSRGHLVQSPPQSSAACSQHNMLIYAVRSWKTSRTETAEPLWATCSTVGLSSAFSYVCSEWGMFQIMPIFSCPPAIFRSRVWLHLSDNCITGVVKLLLNSLKDCSSPGWTSPVSLASPLQKRGQSLSPLGGLPLSLLLFANVFLASRGPKLDTLLYK